jgi:hypothetical protein
MDAMTHKPDHPPLSVISGLTAIIHLLREILEELRAIRKDLRR